MYCLCRWKIQDKHGQRGVHGLLGRDVLDGHGRDAGGNVSFVSDQYVFRGIIVLVPAVPGERSVVGGERVTGVLLLQERVCACDRLAHVPNL